MYIKLFVIEKIILYRYVIDIYSYRYVIVKRKYTHSLIYQFSKNIK